MNILESTVCSSKALANILDIAKNILNLIQILGPILAIISLAVILTKLMANPDNQKLKKFFKNWLIALVMLFFIPIIVNATMNIFDDSFNLAACWNDASSSKSTHTTEYIEDPSKKSQQIIDSPSDYDAGGKRKESSSSSTNISKLIFIGDSRTEGMRDAVKTKDVWSCKSAMGLSWMKSTGVPQIESKITSSSAVIILMGVNDLYQPKAYVSYINSKAKTWENKSAKVYFVSVNPTNGSVSGLNNEINSFNQILKSSLKKSIKYIDTNSYLKSKGFSTTDGTHYDNATYQKIYNYIKKSL